MHLNYIQSNSLSLAVVEELLWRELDGDGAASFKTPSPLSLILWLANVLGFEQAESFTWLAASSPE